MPIHQNIVHKAHAFPQGDQIQVIREIVQIDIRLLKWVRGSKFDFAVPRQGPKKVDNNREVVPLQGSWIMLLEGVRQHRLGHSSVFVKKAFSP